MVRGPCVIFKIWTTSRLRLAQVLHYSGAECIRPKPEMGDIDQKIALDDSPQNALAYSYLDCCRHPYTPPHYPHRQQVDRQWRLGPRLKRTMVMTQCQSMMYTQFIVWVAYAPMRR
jgi:hypothetical protein